MQASLFVFVLDFNTKSNYSLVHSADMDPREFLRLLMDRRGENPHALAAAVKNATKQPQIHKFLAGIAKEPRRTTLQPVADYYGISVDAFYDPEKAQAEWDRINGRSRVAEWPFSNELHEAVKSATPETLNDLENLMRVLLKMPALPSSNGLRKQA